jgi:putative MATE family efflux protein
VKDLTQGSITRHLATMAAPMMIGMLVQTLYYLVDLYYVSRLGNAAVAGVGSGATFALAVMALTQVFSVGTVALIARAVGAKQREHANLVFNQSLVLAGLCSLIALVGGYAVLGPYMRGLGADSATTAAGAEYLRWFIPGLALQFAMVALGSALRGTGIVGPTMTVQMVTVLVNVVLAPVLIAGVGTGHPLGVAGAGLASTLAVCVGVALLGYYYLRLEKYVEIHPELWQPRLETWKQILNIGLPSGFEFGLLFVYQVVVYSVIRDFGPAAQAGFGIGARVMQTFFLPAMAISFAIAPVAAQNFGARSAQRVRETFRSGVLLGAGAMLILMLLCQWRGDRLIGLFTHDPETIAVGSTFLHLISWNFVLSGFSFACSGIFQALGNTWPSVVASGTRLVTFAVPALYLSRQPGFQLEQVWHLSVATVVLQALMAAWWVRREFRQRLQFSH